MGGEEALKQEQPATPPPAQEAGVEARAEARVAEPGVSLLHLGEAYTDAADRQPEETRAEGLGFVDATVGRTNARIDALAASPGLSLPPNRLTGLAERRDTQGAATHLDLLRRTPNFRGTVYQVFADYYINGTDPTNGDEVFYKIGARGALQRTSFTIKDMVGAATKGQLSRNGEWKALPGLSAEDVGTLAQIGLSEVRKGDVKNLDDLSNSQEFQGSDVYEKGGGYYILGKGDVIFEMQDGSALVKTSLQMPDLSEGRIVGKFIRKGMWNPIPNMAPPEAETLKGLGL
jgi:hypothetical protein